MNELGPRSDATQYVWLDWYVTVTSSNPVSDFLKNRRGCVNSELSYGLDGVAEGLVSLLYHGGWKWVKVLFASLSGMLRDDDIEGQLYLLQKWG